MTNSPADKTNEITLASVLGENDRISRRLERYELRPQHLQDGEPALILLNLAMPEVRGIEFLTRLRKHENWQKIPVIAITGVNPLTQFSPEQRKRIQESVQQV